MFQRPAPAEKAQEFQRITQIPQNLPTQSANSAKFAPFVNISYVSDTCPSREPSAIPANYANSAQFAHTVRESCEIRTICLHYTLCFRCLTSGRELPKIPANQAKFTEFAHISRELREFREFRAFRSKLIHI